MSLKITDIKQKDFSRPLSGSLKTSEQQFIEFLTSLGFILKVDGLVETNANAGVFGRAYIVKDGVKKDTGYYQWYPNRDTGTPYGSAHDWSSSSQDALIGKWNGKGVPAAPQTKAEKEAGDRATEQAKIAQAEEDKKNIAASNAEWDSSPEADSNHPYLIKKQVGSHGLRQDKDGRLVVPVCKSTKEIVGLQYIYPNGKKMIRRGTKKKGNYFVLGAHLVKAAKKINYAEGFSTGASYHQDMNEPVVVCFDAGNLDSVGDKFSDLFPEAMHIFIADFDESDTGKIKAVKACQTILAKGVQCEVHIPQTAGDYNDKTNEMVGELLPTMNVVEVARTVEGELVGAVEFELNGKKVLNTRENMQAVLTKNDIHVYYNVIKKVTEYHIPDVNLGTDNKEKNALTEIKSRCAKESMPLSLVADYCYLLAEEYNPVRDWMESVPWDGTSRLQEFLDTIQSSNEKLKNVLMTKWLVGCVAAACEPNGVALEGMLVFQGAQGLGKTLWFKNLADYEEGWLLEGATLNPADKDSVKISVSHWLVELGEIESTFKKSDIDQLKAFVTKKSDELRLSYDKDFSHYHRRTAFYASVNAREFLTDTSGNRRFWVVPVTGINAMHGINMQQLWAEVKEVLYPTVSWYLTSDEREMLQDSNEYYRTQSSVEDLILQHVHFSSIGPTKPVQMTQLLRDLGISQPRMADIKDAARILSVGGIEPRKSNGKKVYDLDYTPADLGNNDKFGGSYTKDF